MAGESIEAGTDLLNKPALAIVPPAPEATPEPGITDLDKIYDLKELAKGDCIFAATGVTDGSLLDGVKRLPGGKLTTESVVMRASTGTVRWVKGEHRLNHKPV